MKIDNFFAELKRRHVYRAAVFYAMAAWLLVQIATQVFPFFDVPNWAVRFVIVALVIGFPIAMLLASIFELTPEGIVRTEDVGSGGATSKSAGRKCSESVRKSAASFESLAKEAPLSADRHANLGWLYAFMGRKDDAIHEGQRAVELKPESKDAFDGAIMNCYLALIYARLGQRELALPLVERLLKTPGAVDSVDYSITLNDLKFRWEWDPLRDDPRFQKLMQDVLAEKQ